MIFPITVYLSQQERKARKLFGTLHKLGLDDCFFQPHLDTLILRSVGLDDGTDETFDAYLDIMEKRSTKIEADHDSVAKQALKAYTELMNEKERSKRNKSNPPPLPQ